MAGVHWTPLLKYCSNSSLFQTIRAPGPDLACNAEAGLPGLINIIDIAIFAGEVAPGQAGRAAIFTPPAPPAQWNAFSINIPSGLNLGAYKLLLR